MAHSGCSDKCSLGPGRLFNNERYVGCYAGALVDRTAIPWRDIIASLENGNDAIFMTFHANHSIIVYDKVDKVVYLIADQFGQHSLYAGMSEGKFIGGSSLLTFLHVLDKPELNPSWLHEYFYFNYPLEDTTLLKSVERIGPGRIVQLDLGSGKRTERRYAPQLERKPTHMTMREAQERALERFNERFPHYYDNIEPHGCGVGVTGGFDARIVSSYMPEGRKAHLYTYGIDGCSDMVNGKKVADRLGLEHHAFAFGSIGEGELYRLALDTIYYSGGNLNALRATLAKVYEHLTGVGLGVILTGVSSGHFFRGVFSTPQVLSAGLVDFIRDPDHPMDEFYQQLFVDRDAFLGSVEAKREYLKDRLGWNDMAVEERHMVFMHYEQAPKYFGGELAFAESFGHMRSPFWDSRIRELSFEIPLSTLYNSVFLDHLTLPWVSKAMLGYILANGRLRGLKVDEMPPKYWAAGTKLSYYTGKILYKGLEKIKNRIPGMRVPPIPLEDWGAWIRMAFKPLMSDNFSERPLSRFISADAARKVLAGDTDDAMVMHWVGKIITASMVIDLVKKRLPHFDE